MKNIMIIIFAVLVSVMLLVSPLLGEQLPLLVGFENLINQMNDGRSLSVLIIVFLVVNMIISTMAHEQNQTHEKKRTLKILDLMCEIVVMLSIAVKIYYVLRRDAVMTTVQTMTVLAGIVVLVMGSVIGKSRFRGVWGLTTTVTYASRANWIKTNGVVGALASVSGILMIIAGSKLTGAIAIVSSFAAMAACTVVAFIYYNKFYK